LIELWAWPNWRIWVTWSSFPGLAVGNLHNLFLFSWHINVFPHRLIHYEMRKPDYIFKLSNLFERVSSVRCTKYKVKLSYAEPHSRFPLQFPNDLPWGVWDLFSTSRFHSVLPRRMYRLEGTQSWEDLTSGKTKLKPLCYFISNQGNWQKTIVYTGDWNEQYLQ
jgi:hypothetical protein